MRKKQLAIIALGGWLILISVLMILAQAVDLGVFFIVSFIGILVTIKLMDQKYVQPVYVKYFWYIIGVGVVICGIIAAQKTMKNL